MTLDAAVALAREVATSAGISSLRRHALAALEQLGGGLREPELHYRRGRTLAQTRAWAVDALARAPRE